MTGSIAAPLLAGFSLTTAAQLVIGKDHPWLFEWAIALFAVAAALLVYSVQFSIIALGYAATPSERLEYNPEAASRVEILRIVRKRQWEEMELRARYSVRARLCYNLGLLAFLGGFGLIMVPNRAWPWPWGQAIGVAAIGIAFALQAVWMLSNGLRPKWLLPTASSVVPDDIPDEGAEHLFGARVDHDVVNGLRRVADQLEKIVSPRIHHDGKLTISHPDDSVSTQDAE
jgi:hypothetical protein